MNISNLIAVWEAGTNPVSCRGERLVVWKVVTRLHNSSEGGR